MFSLYTKEKNVNNNNNNYKITEVVCYTDVQKFNFVQKKSVGFIL